MIKIRTYTAADYPAIVAMRNAVYHEPANETIVRESDERDDAIGTRWTRLVAEDAAGDAVGYARAGHSSWLPANHFMLQVVVRADRRRHGVGSLLLRTAEEWALANGATGEFAAMIQGGDDGSFAWAQSQGYYMDLQRTESVLDLTDWDGSRFAGHLDKVRAGGITLLALPEVESDELLRQIYDVEAATVPDVPDYEGHMASWEEWRKDFRSDKTPQLYALALDGERLVGQSVLGLPRVAGGGAYTGYTGVLREYRGRGIALAVKLLTVEAAVADGRPHMRTNNDEENPAMLAVNEKLGYRMLPGPRRMKKKL